MHCKVIFACISILVTNEWVSSEPINPFENNDKLGGIHSLYVAEWQWESWPMKQSAVESPGARHNVALWPDLSLGSWYLFGGQPIDADTSKRYSDIWRYSSGTRVWDRVFPSETDGKNRNLNKIGVASSPDDGDTPKPADDKISGMMTLRANLFDDGYAKKSSKEQRESPSVILCGRITKKPPEKPTTKTPYNFTRRKKQGTRNGIEESKSLAVYGPKTTKSNTVWQIDLKDKLWTAYVCCCDTANEQSQTNNTFTDRIKTFHSTDSQNGTQQTKLTSVRIDKAEDKVENEQQHMTLKPKKKKINQIKRKIEKKQRDRTNEDPEEKQGAELTSHLRTIHIFDNLQIMTNDTPGQDEEASSNSSLSTHSTAHSSTVRSPTPQPLSMITAVPWTVGVPLSTGALATTSKLLLTEQVPTTPTQNISLVRAEHFDETQEPDAKNVTAVASNKTIVNPKTSSKYCPEFAEEGRPISWCDGAGDALNTVDLSNPDIVLWSFNLRTSHWSQKEVTASEGWTGCRDSNTLRHIGNGDEVFIFCSTGASAVHEVFRINSRSQALQQLGVIQLPSLFATPRGRQMWANESLTILHVAHTASNDTILFLAHQDDIELWILIDDTFQPVQKVWRGSALKWLKQYNGPLYNLQLATEDAGLETLLIVNPRDVADNDYWPNERGRFIVRILKNDNMRKRHFENRTREQNLTFELLQSEYSTDTEDSEFTLKAFFLFGVTLAVFIVVLSVLLIRRCAGYRPLLARMRGDHDYHKSPPIIRYSVIPDDLLYQIHTKT